MGIASLRRVWARGHAHVGWQVLNLWQPISVHLDSAKAPSATRRNSESLILSSVLLQKYVKLDRSDEPLNG
jgi:hypothetical protein